jgi:hypothetical protein
MPRAHHVKKAATLTPAVTNACNVNPGNFKMFPSWALSLQAVNFAVLVNNLQAAINRVLFVHPIHIKDLTLPPRSPASIAPVGSFRAEEAKIAHQPNHFPVTKAPCLVGMGRVVHFANPGCIKMKKVRTRTRHASIVRLAKNLWVSCCRVVFAPQIITKLKTMFLRPDANIVRLGKRTLILRLPVKIALLACTNQQQFQQLVWHANIVRLERGF